MKQTKKQKTKYNAAAMGRVAEYVQNAMAARFPVLSGCKVCIYINNFGAIHYEITKGGHAFTGEQSAAFDEFCAAGRRLFPFCTPSKTK